MLLGLSSHTDAIHPLSSLSACEIEEKAVLTVIAVSKEHMYCEAEPLGPGYLLDE